MKRSFWHPLVKGSGQVVLTLTVLIAPWLFGGVDAWGRHLLSYGVISSLFLAFLFVLLHDRPERKLPTVLIPMVLALALVGGHLFGMSSSMLSFFSPRAEELWEALLPNAGTPEAKLIEDQTGLASVEHHTMTLSPSSTRSSLSLWIVVFGALLAGYFLFDTSLSRLWLLGLVAVNGALITMFGVLQQFGSDPERIYWKYQSGGVPFGPFGDRTSAAGYLTICLGAVLAWICYSFFRRSSLRRDQDDEDWNPSPRRFRRRQGGQALIPVGVVGWFLVATMLVGGVLLSEATGTVVAMAVAILLTGVVIFLVRWELLSISKYFFFLVLGLILLVGLGQHEEIRHRFSYFFELSRTSDPVNASSNQWKSPLPSASDFRWRGSGLGTYRYVYPMINFTPELPGQFVHAENQYVEWLIETGTIGFFLLMLAILLMGLVLWQLLQQTEKTAGFSLGIGGFFIFSSQAMIAGTGSSLSLPANALLLATLFGAISRSAIQHHELWRWRSLWLGFSVEKLFGLLLLFSMIMLGLWSAKQFHKEAQVAEAMKGTLIAPTPEAIDRETLREKIQELQKALKENPEHSQGQWRLATLWFHLYRLELWEQYLAQGYSPSDPVAWGKTAPAQIHGVLHWLHRNEFEEGVERFREDPIVKATIEPGLVHLVLSRRANPLHPEVHLALAMLRPYFDQHFEMDSLEARCIQRAQRVAPNDPNVLYDCGTLEYQAGNTDKALGFWKRSLTLSPEHLHEIVQVVKQLVDQGSDPTDVLRKVFPRNPVLLFGLLEKAWFDPSPELGEAMFDRLEELLLTESPEPPLQEMINGGKKWYYLARVAAMRDNRKAAMLYFEEALNFQPQNEKWCYEYALVLFDEQEWELCREQVRRCVRMDRENQLYRNFLKKVTDRLLRSTPTQYDEKEERPSRPFE